jgi:hypothetical protein
LSKRGIASTSLLIPVFYLYENRACTLPSQSDALHEAQCDKQDRTQGADG